MSKPTTCTKADLEVDRPVSSEQQPHPHDLLEESAAARVPLLRTAPRGAALDPSTRSRTLDTARQAPGDLNANVLPPMSPPNLRRPVRQIPYAAYASAAVLRPATFAGSLHVEPGQFSIDLIDH